MRMLVLTNNLAGCRRVAAGLPAPVRYLRLSETRESVQLAAYLREKLVAREISVEALSRANGSRFRQAYINAMADLNVQNHSLIWWARPFTTKNPLSTDLCRTAFYSVQIAHLMSAEAGTLVVITDNASLIAHLRSWARTQGVRCRQAVARYLSWRQRLKCSKLCILLVSWMRTAWLWWLVRRYRPQRNFSQGYLIVMSLLHPRSYGSDGTYHDLYFGRLINHVGGMRQPAMLFGWLVEEPGVQVRRLAALRPPIPVVPLESCLSLVDLVRCGMLAWSGYVGPICLRGSVVIDGHDLTTLIQSALRDNERLSSFFANLRVYYCARSLARRLQVARCLYPYENRGFEKMLLLGLREAAPSARMIGYQHTAITDSHTNFFLSQDEARVTPLPDVLLTTGEVVREWLDREGNYPAGLVKTACALRQEMNGLLPRVRGPAPLRNVLVVLATSLQEYVRTLNVLGEAFNGDPTYTVRIRPHPTIRLKTALAMAPLTRRDFLTQSTGTLQEDLVWADVVVYSSSTVGLEAMASGIPVIYLDLADFLDTDPLKGWTCFKWTVDSAERFRAVLREIEAMPSTTYRAHQAEASAYVRRYLRPSTSEALDSFLAA